MKQNGKRTNTRKNTRKNTRTNPRKIPCTFADVKKAEREGILRGIKQAIKMMLYILLDKHDAPAEDEQQLAKELNWLSNAIVNGGLKWEDVDYVLDEYEVDLTWI